MEPNGDLLQNYFELALGDAGQDMREMLDIRLSP
jgi:hypothetical protein